MDIESVKTERKEVITYEVAVHEGESGIVLRIDETGTVHVRRYFEVLSNKQEIGQMPSYLLPALRAAIDMVLAKKETM